MARQNINAFDLVTLTPIAPPGPRIRCHLPGDGVLAGGGGGWEVVPRPRRKAATEWVGADAFTLSAPLLLDGVDLLGDDVDTSVEVECDRLASWLLPTEATKRPPLLLVDGPLPVPAGNPRWVLQGIEWGAAERSRERARVRQEVTITLLEHTAAEILRGPAAAARARARSR